MPHQTSKVYSARKFLSRSTQELIQMVSGQFHVLFDDGQTLLMKDQELLISSIFWDFHRQLPWLPLNSNHTINWALGGKLFNSGTHRKLFEKIYWDIHDTATQLGKPIDHIQRDRLNEMIYRKSNELYNYSCNQLGRYVSSVDMDDYHELMEYPPFKEILENIEPTDHGIAVAYEKATEVIMKDEKLKNNPLVVAARSGVIKTNQLLQVVVVRGNVTDIDSMIFPEPSLGNFIQGYKDWYSLLIDTRTAAKSLFFSAQLLRNSEYNSRKLQFLCGSFQTVYEGDCGSTHYMHFKIRPNTYNPDGSLARKGDAERFYGKYFIDDETGKLKEFKPSNAEKYLGQTLRFRSFLAGCKHPDPHGVCQACFSSMSQVFVKRTNVGWYLSAALMQILNQSILAVKHIDSSSSSNAAVLSAEQSKWLEVDKTGNAFRFNRNIIGKSIRLIASADQVPSIATLVGVEDISSVMPSQHSELSVVLLEVMDKNQLDGVQVALDLTYEKRNTYFTLEALQYIKEKGYTRTDKGQFVFDFSDWDNREPFVELPARHFNNADHAKEISTLIQGRSSDTYDRQKRRQEGSVVEYFYKLYDLVNSRLDIPAVVIESITFGASIRSSKDDDYRLPKAGTTREMGLSASTVPFRSTGAAMGYEQLTRELFRATTGFNHKKSSSHVMDVFVMPEEVVKDFERMETKFDAIKLPPVVTED